MDKDKSSNKQVLGEIQRVLNQQSSIVQNQQNQATKILRVVLTLAGLLLTLTSIGVSVVSSNVGPDTGIAEYLISNLSITSTVLGVVGLYALVIVLGAFGVIFVSAFRVLSPVTGRSGNTSISISILKPAINASLINSFLKIYDQILPFISISVIYQIDRERISLRPGIDGDKAKAILNTADENRVEEILEYDSGCIEKNEELIEENRSLLSNIYTTSIILTLLFVTLILLGFAYLLPAVS